MISLFSFLTVFSILSQLAPLHAKVVRVELTATQGTVNLSGKKSVDFALMLNGQIPAPTLEFTEGDQAEIIVHNKIPGQELSIHWHGILLPVEMDGVPYVTTPPIESGQSYTFRFPIRQHGTYWYHSHTNVQEQKGLYGGIVIHPKKPTLLYDRDVVVVLSDWSDENAIEVLKNLRKDGDYYLYKKNTVRSWWGAIQNKALGTYLHNDWTRMGGMDLSDVGYDAFLINGQRDSQLTHTKKGERIRIRIINAAASSYFYIRMGGGPMRVIAADGVDIAPVLAQEILAGMAETYDILLDADGEQNLELTAIAQDGTGRASTWIGQGSKAAAPDRAIPNLYASMDHQSGHHASHEETHSHHHEHHGTVPKIIPTLEVDQIASVAPTDFNKTIPVRELKLVLDGDMSRYVWHINGKVISQDRTITIQKDEVVRFVFENKTMMHHPMHLHGHFFRVINAFGERSPLKHTVDVPPHSTRTIEFLANEPGDWMLHCHNLYHMKGGMARVVKYMSFTPSPEIQELQKQDPHLHDHYYFYGQTEVATNHAQLYLRSSQTWNQFEARVETSNSSPRPFDLEKKWDWEGDLLYRRWSGNFLNFAVGASSFQEENSALAGVGYTLPFLFKTTTFLNHRGKLRFDLERHFQWTQTIFSEVELKWRPGFEKSPSHEFEYDVSLMYGPQWHWAVGLTLTEESWGAGLKMQF